MGMRRVVWAVGLVMTVAAGAGCKPSMIPGSTVESTMENRELGDVVERYRSGLESRKPENVLRLVSADYFEDNGTADPSDDYDFNGLSQRLKEDMERTQVVRMSVRMQRVEIDGDRAYVDLRYQTRTLVSFPSGEQWVTRTDDNRLSFRREGGRWMIVAGA